MLSASLSEHKLHWSNKCTQFHFAREPHEHRVTTKGNNTKNTHHPPKKEVPMPTEINNDTLTDDTKGEQLERTRANLDNFGGRYSERALIDGTSYAYTYE
jgi:hypothetical protein